MTTQEAIEILRDTPIDIRSTREDDIHTLYATAQGMAIEALSAQPDNRLSKIADLVEGTIDHFDLDDAIDLIYQIKDVLDGSDELPSAQPEIVRCKDCKHLPKFKINNNFYCLNENGLHGCVQLDDYCSYGERGEWDDE